MSLPEVCVVFLLRRGRAGAEVLLGHRRSGADRGRLAGIRGRVGLGEDAAEAAVREVRDEVGVRVEASDLLAVGRIEHHFPTRPGWSHQSCVFVCRRWDGEPVQLDGLTPRWYALDAVPYARMGDDASRWLPGVLRGGTVDARFTFGADLATVVLMAE